MEFPNLLRSCEIDRFLRVAALRPTERTFASGVTNLARNLFWAVGSGVAGMTMQALSFSTPLLVGEGAKVLYDLLLFRSFRKLKPPEEINQDPQMTERQMGAS
jgi:predicted MFS family arabinose efflux permease